MAVGKMYEKRSASHIERHGQHNGCVARARCVRLPGHGKAQKSCQQQRPNSPPRTATVANGLYVRHRIFGERSGSQGNENRP